MPWASPSVLDRVIACPASAVLPQGPDITGPTAQWGKEVHAFKEGEEPTPRVKKWYEENYPDGYKEMLWPGGRHEIVYYEQNGKIEELNLRPSFAARELWPRDGMFFSLDWENLHDGPMPWVDDLKTGRMPESWTQLKCYSWALYQRYPWIKENLASFTNWTRYPKGTDAVRKTQVFTRPQIESWYDKTVVPAKRLALGPTAKNHVNPGPHCRWCRSKPYCPAWADGTPREYYDEDEHRN
jgi:hypothetical protein